MVSFVKASLRSIRCWVLSLLLIGLSTAMDLAAAPLPTPLEPNVTRPGYIWFRFPVTWELMRSGFNALDVALEAESYAEYWALLYLSRDEIELFTPRGRVRVTGIQSSPEEGNSFPDLLILSEADFARLLGLEPDPAGLEKSIIIDLPTRESNEQNFTLNASPKYFVSVQLNIIF